MNSKIRTSSEEPKDERVNEQSTWFSLVRRKLVLLEQAWIDLVARDGQVYKMSKAAKQPLSRLGSKKKHLVFFCSFSIWKDTYDVLSNDTLRRCEDSSTASATSAASEVVHVVCHFLRHVLRMGVYEKWNQIHTAGNLPRSTALSWRMHPPITRFKFNLDSG